MESSWVFLFPSFQSIFCCLFCLKPYKESPLLRVETNMASSWPAETCPFLAPSPTMPLSSPAPLPGPSHSQKPPSHAPFPCCSLLLFLAELLCFLLCTGSPGYSGAPPPPCRLLNMDQICIPIQFSADFFWKGPDSKYFLIFRPQHLWCNNLDQQF